MGHTEKVNNSNDTHDIINMDYKMEIVKRVNENIDFSQCRQRDLNPHVVAHNRF